MEMMGTKGNRSNIMRFKTDPFYLYPVKEDMIDTLFIDREEEISIARGVLGTKFEDTVEICAVVGGIGVGKSSMLHYVANAAKDMGYDTFFFDNPDDFYSTNEKKSKKASVDLIDNVDKLDDEKTKKFYSFVEKKAQKSRSIVFFSDNYSRSRETQKLRDFTVSQHLSLPRGLSLEKLRYFLEERMKRCLARGNKYSPPFDDKALNMASVRSNGNLRNFLNYTKNGWMVATGGGRGMVTEKDMKGGMIIVDRALLGSCDLTDFRILWHSTTGDINKSYLAHLCGIDTKTLDSHIQDRLTDLVTQKRSGKDILVTSIYRYIDGGEEIMIKVIEGLGIHKKDVTG